MKFCLANGSVIVAFVTLETCILIKTKMPDKIPQSMNIRKMNSCVPSAYFHA